MHGHCFIDLTLYRPNVML